MLKYYHRDVIKAIQRHFLQPDSKVAIEDLIRLAYLYGQNGEENEMRFAYFDFLKSIFERLFENRSKLNSSQLRSVCKSVGYC